MSDEKRQTSLLKFQLRRGGAGSVRPSELKSDARDVAADGEGFSEDAELSALLRAWEAPGPTALARGRLLAEFRAGGVRAPLWRRALSAELRVPLPVAVCAVLALLASLFALAARTQTRPPAATQSTHADVRTTDAPDAKIVELPSERERVVTRYIYVEKNAPRGGAERPAVNQQNYAARQSTPTRRSAAPTRGALAQSDSNREDAAGQMSVVESGAQSTAEPTSYFTRVDMADFQPSEKMELRIVKRGKADEK